MAGNPRAAAGGGLAATFVVSLAFAPRLISGNPDEVRVRNSSANGPAVQPEEPDSEPGAARPADETSSSTSTAPAPVTATTRRDRGQPVEAPTTSTTPTTRPTDPSLELPSTTTTTTVSPPPQLTGVQASPANPYAAWTYSDAVRVSWGITPSFSVDGVRIRYGTTVVESVTCCSVMVTGLTPGTTYSFEVSPYNRAGEGPAVNVSATTRQDNAPELSSMTKPSAGAFRITAKNLHSAFVSLAVPGIDTVEHPPIPICSAYAEPTADQVDCVFSDLDPGHWKVDSIRIVDDEGRSATYFADGHLVEYGLAAMKATSVAGPYQKTSVDFGPFEFDI